MTGAPNRFPVRHRAIDPDERRPRATCGAAVLLALVLLPACGRDVEVVGGRVVIDGLGVRVLVPATPRRIVSLAPSVTELLFALDLGDRVVGITDFCVPPPGAAPPVRVGGILNPSLEAIHELHPDLLIATTSGNDPALASQAAALGLPLYTVHADTVEEVLESAARLADALGEPERGTRLAEEIRLRLRAIEARLSGASPIRVLYVVWNDPLIVPGGSAFLTDALRRAGAEVVTADMAAAWPTFSLEAAIARAPEAILTSPHNPRLAEILARDPVWSGVPAVRDGRIHVVSAVLEQPGPGVIEGIEEVARILHPDRFGEGPDGGPQEALPPEK